MGNLKPKKIPVKSYEYKREGKTIKVKRHLRTYYVKAKTKAKSAGRTIKRHRKKVVAGGAILAIGVIGKKKYDIKLTEAFNALIKAAKRLRKRTPVIGEKVIRSKINKLAETLTKHAQSKGLKVDVTEYGYHPDKKRGFIIIKFQTEGDAKKYYHRYLEPLLMRRPGFNFSRTGRSVYIDMKF